MAVTIDATPSGAAANSYLTVAAATMRLEGRLRVTAWTSASADERARALVMATQYLDLSVPWDMARIGWARTSTAQALLFPRVGTLNLEGDAYLGSNVIPDFIQNATAEAALGLLTTDRLADPSGRGIESMSVGPLSLSFDTMTAGIIRPLSDAVWLLLEPWTLSTPLGGPNALHVAELVR